jgi:hypothetical protein
VVLGLVAALNFGIGLFVPASGRGIWAKADGSLTHLVHTDQDTVDRRYGFYMELGDAAAGSTLFVPTGSPVDADVAAGLSGVVVVEEQYDATRIPSAGYWWLGRGSGGLLVIPESTAPRPSS